MYVFNVITKKSEQKNLTKDNSIDGECLKSLFSLVKMEKSSNNEEELQHSS